MIRTRLNFALTLPLVALLFLAGGNNLAQAQVSTDATILGTVTDSSGAVVAGASILVRNTGTGIARTVTTDALGRYTATPLVVGAYDVQAEKKGFRTVVRRGVTLTVNSQMVIDFTLPVGQAEQTVIVQGAAEQVNTTTSTISDLVDKEQMRDLPLNGRNFQQLITLAPGVQIAQTSAASISLYGKGATYTVAGLRPEDQAYLLDGTDISNYFGHGAGSSAIGTSLGVDAIAEFQVLTNTYSAEYGGYGAVVNAVSLSGTNQFHGSGFEFIRNSALDARNYFDALSGPPPFKRNQFGGTLGGPIKKDKAFFFFNYEGLRQAEARTEVAYIPDADALQGIVGNVNYGVNPAMVPLLDLFPNPNGAVNPDGSGIVSVPQVATEIAHENYELARFDYVFTPKDTLFTRVVSDRSDFVSPFTFGQVPLWPDLQQSPNLYITTEERHIFMHMVNSARVSYVRTDNHGAVIPNLPQFDFVPGQGDGAVVTTGLSNMGGFVDDPFRGLQNKIGVSDDVIATKGAHTLTFGFGVLNEQSLIWSPTFATGFYVFGGVAGLVQDQPLVFMGAPPDQNDAYHWFHEVYLTPYINDDWKVSRKLTLNLGLRYDLTTNPTCESKGTATNDCTMLIHPLTDATFTPVDHPFASNPSTRNLEPRIGFVYDPFNDQKTSLRGGFGIFDDVIAPHVYANPFAQNPPFNLLTTPGVFSPYPTPCLVIGPTCPNVGLPSGSIGQVAYNNTHTPYTMEWNLNIQRELFKDSILTVGYVGSHGVHEFALRDANPPIPTIDASGVWHFGSTRANPNVGTFDESIPDADSSYNSLQVNWVRHFSHNVQAQAAYTYSKCIDIADASDVLGGGASFQNPYDERAERAACGYNVPQSLRLNSVYVLPFKGNRLVAGWQLSGLYTATSGPPFTPLVGWDVAGYSNQAALYPIERPNMAPGFTCSNSLVTGNPNDWFNQNAFVMPEPGTIGNAPRDCMRAPGVFDTDFSISKETAISEGVRAQFRAEFFNIFNNTSFQYPYNGSAPGLGAPWNNLFEQGGTRDPVAGMMTATSGTSRQIQFGLKILF